MRLIVLASLLLAAPAAASEVRTSSGTPYADTRSVSLILERTSHTDPFTRSGASSFSPAALGPGAYLDTRSWHLEFAAQLLDRSLRQRRIATTMSRMFVHHGALSLGIEADYWELGFRQRAVRIVDTDVMTDRQGRAVLGGMTARWNGPRSTSLSCSTAAGWYENRYDSTVSAGAMLVSEPVASDRALIGKVRCGIRTGAIANRLSLQASVRHFRLFGTHSSWTPESEWSGDAAMDVRIFTRKRKSLLVGATSRFGPRGPGLVTDKAFGLRGTWKMR